MCGSSGLYAQIIRGTVKDKTDLGLPGVNVLVKGTAIGTMTDIDGKFELDVKGGKTLEFTMIGYENQEITIQDAATEIKVLMKDDTQQLDEVVVTALGIKRERKALGYAMQEIKGDAILESREANVANALSGKISGLQVVRSSTGAGGSSKITIRGSNSLSGNNQPLIVVDGIPMNNFIGGGEDMDAFSGKIDMGSGISDINPDDIESMSVLKGGSAAALYGTRAGNGVILITTKSGKAQEGLGITVSAGLNVSSMFLTPHLQNDFGQGYDNVFSANNSNSWGPKITGQTVIGWDGVERPLQAYNNLSNFFGTGITATENISFQQQVNKTSVFASINRMDDKGISPFAKLNRTSMTARFTTNLGASNKWTLDVKANYINAVGNNRPLSGKDNGPYFTVLTMPRSLDILQFKNSRGDDKKMIWYADGSQDNPWWVSQYMQNRDVRDRLMGTFSLKYQFTDWLNGEAKVGTDYYTTLYTKKTYSGGNSNPEGSYTERSETFFENNYSYLFTANKDKIFSKFGGFVTLGGNLMHQRNQELEARAGKLVKPDIFNVQNSANLSTKFHATPQKINSLFGSAQVNWDGYLFLDLTLRRDWASTMSKENRAFSYPSVSFSGVISDMFSKVGVLLPEWLTFAKVRGSYAEVGNALAPFQLRNIYNINNDGNGNVTLAPDKTLYNENLRNEIVKSKEIGAEVRFFRNRLGIDAAWYRSNATNQLMSIPKDPTSGYDFEKVNAGNIQNQGWELMLDGRILENSQGLSWNTVLNLSTNRNKILYLTDEVSSYDLDKFDLITVRAVAGSGYGDIYGHGYRRVTDPQSAYFNKIIVNDNGLPLTDPDRKLGNQQAKWLMGITNSFNYKGFNLSFLVDSRFGGEIYSGTEGLLNMMGAGAATVQNGQRNDFVVPNSVVADGNGGYTENTKAVSPQYYWRELKEGSAGNVGLGEEYTRSATNVRLRNITLAYNFGKKFISKTPFQKLTVSTSCNNVWMIHSNFPGIDPESIMLTNSNATGIEMGAIPTMRTFSFNLVVGF